MSAAELLKGLTDDGLSRFYRLVLAEMLGRNRGPLGPDAQPVSVAAAYRPLGRRLEDDPAAVVSYVLPRLTDTKALAAASDALIGLAVQRLMREAAGRPIRLKLGGEVAVFLDPK